VALDDPQRQRPVWCLNGECRDARQSSVDHRTMHDAGPVQESRIDIEAGDHVTVVTGHRVWKKRCV
jgi:hypothetical protein